MRRCMVIGLGLLLGLPAAWAADSAATAPAPSRQPALSASSVQTTTQPESDAAGEARTESTARWLIKRLGSEKYAERDSAQRKLTEMGWMVVPELRKAQQDKNPEIANRAAQAIEAILAMIEDRRNELRQAAEQAVKDEDFPAGRKHYLALLGLPETQLRDVRSAIRLFEQREDWPALATAYQAAGESMWRVTHMPPGAFTRPAPQAPGNGERPGPLVQVQTNLDGEWSNCRGQAEDWNDWIQRKQKEFVLERLGVLKKLGQLCMDRLDSPSRAAAAHASAGKNVPLCTEPIEKLIPQIWPKLTADRVNLLAMDHVGAAHFRQDMLAGLADAQVRLGDLRAAAETRLRAMLASLFDCKGDWNSHGPAIRAEEFWQVVRRLPADKPLPPTLWLHVLDANKPAMEFDSPEAGPHHYPLSFPGPRVVIRPGQTARTLTVSADMETPGGGGRVRCFSMIDGKVADLGDVLWYKDNRKGREWRTSTFEVPKGVGIIRLEIEPWSGSNFHVRALKVQARFDPGPRADAAAAPASSPVPNGTSTQPAAAAAEIERLIKQLGSEKFAERDAAQQALVKIGKLAVSRLVSALGTQDPEIAVRASDILASIGLAATAELRKGTKGGDNQARRCEETLKRIAGRVFAFVDAHPLGIPYAAARKQVDPNLLPELLLAMRDAAYVPRWQRVAMLIAIVGDDESCAKTVLDYVRAPEGWDSNVYDERVILKAQTLMWAGRIGGAATCATLRQALSAEGARELIKEWAQGPLPPWAREKTNLIDQVRGSAAMGLVLAQDAKGMKLVERLYWEVHSEVRRNKDLGKMHSGLISAMAARDLIADIGMDKYLNERVGSDVSWEDLRRYHEKYRSAPPKQPAKRADALGPAQTAEGEFKLSKSVPLRVGAKVEGQPDLLTCKSISFSDSNGGGILHALVQMERGWYRRCACAVRVELLDDKGAALAYVERVFGRRPGGPSSNKGATGEQSFFMGASGPLLRAKRFRLSVQPIESDVLASMEGVLDLEHGLIDWLTEYQPDGSQLMELGQLKIVPSGKDGAKASLIFQYQPARDELCRARVELMDSRGKVVVKREEPLILKANAKDLPGIRESGRGGHVRNEFEIDLGRVDLKAATRYRLSLLKQVPDQAPKAAPSATQPAK